MTNRSDLHSRNIFLMFQKYLFGVKYEDQGNRGPMAVNFLYNYLLMYSNKLAYFVPITVLVYGRSPPKSHEHL